MQVKILGVDKVLHLAPSREEIDVLIKALDWYNKGTLNEDYAIVNKLITTLRTTFER